MNTIRLFAFTVLALSLGGCATLGEKQAYGKAKKVLAGKPVKEGYITGAVKGWVRAMSAEDIAAMKAAEAKAIADAAEAEAAKEAARVKAEADVLAAEEAKKDALRKLVPCAQQ